VTVMETRKKKAQVSVYLDPAIMTMLADHAARRGQSQSMIAEAAIASFLSPDAAERREAVIAKRLDQLDRRMTRLERDSGIAVESLAVFIKFWLATTPALQEPAAQAARATMLEDLSFCERSSSIAASPPNRCETPVVSNTRPSGGSTATCGE